MTPEQVLEHVREANLELIAIDYVDWGGILRGRTVSRDHLASVLEHGLNAAQTNISIAPDDHESDPAMGPQTGDFWLIPGTSTFGVQPYPPGFGHMMADVVDARGEPWFGDPRSALRRVVEQATRELGLVRLGFEQEGHLIRREGGRYVKSFDTRVFLADFQQELAPFFVEMTRSLRAMGSPLEKFTVEGPHGMVELNFRFDEPLAAADHHVWFKQAFRSLARTQGLIGSFMPKPFEDVPGAGCHMHVSLADPKSGADLFGDPNDPRGLGLSSAAYGFLGGLIEHADALCAVACASVNSYKRLQPGMWAPAFKGYGLGNRSAMIRVVEHREMPDERPQARLELRCPDGSANSYLLAAAIIACGSDGVKRDLDPGDPSGVDFGQLTDEGDGARFLPRSLDRAADALDRNEALRDALGDQLVDGYLKVKRHEWQAYSKTVSDWEYRTYLEFL